MLQECGKCGRYLNGMSYHVEVRPGIFHHGEFDGITLGNRGGMWYCEKCWIHLMGLALKEVAETDVL